MEHRHAIAQSHIHTVVTQPDGRPHMTRGEYEQRSLGYWQHYLHACEKHPFFARGIMTPGLKEPTCIFWKDEAREYKILRETKPTVEVILKGELAECYSALSEGDLSKAHNEIADAIAVLVRLDEQLEALYKEEKGE